MLNIYCGINLLQYILITQIMIHDKNMTEISMSHNTAAVDTVCVLVCICFATEICDQIFLKLLLTAIILLILTCTMTVYLFTVCFKAVYATFLLYGMGFEQTCQYHSYASCVSKRLCRPTYYFTGCFTTN